MNELKKNRLKLIGVLLIGITVGAIGTYVFSVYHVINAVASMEDAPYMQGFMLGFGSGGTMMYEYYYCSDVANEEEFMECYDPEKAADDFNKAINETYSGKMIIGSLDMYKGNDGISEWIQRSEERTRRGIFGFTVPIEKDEEWKKLYCD